MSEAVSPPCGAVLPGKSLARATSIGDRAGVRRAVVVFVKVDLGHYHRAWITREDGETFGLRLHVRHDLPHFAVESALMVTDGLWGGLVEAGRYPGLTPEHLAAKALTNAIAPSAAEVRTILSYSRRDLSGREGFNADVAAAASRLVDERLEEVDDVDLRYASDLRLELYCRWAATSVGDKLTLQWPLERSVREIPAFG